jgi:transcriptional regulator with AAA-type ATPase domain
VLRFQLVSALIGLRSFILCIGMYTFCMSILTESERRFLTAVSKLAYCNPFLPERTDHERTALGKDYVSREIVWSASVKDPASTSPNVGRLHARLAPLIENIYARRGALTGTDAAIYEDCVHHLLYQRYYPQFVAANGAWGFYRAFAADWNRYLTRDGFQFETAPECAHFFACFRQVQRAFHHIFDNIIGNSMPAARLRASVWQSVFTHDLRRYRRILYSRMHDFPTLITGPSGTGKELVARAIAGSRYVSFQPTHLRFTDPPHETFVAVNLAALSPTLIESELFGHRRGSFTGAIGDRKGWLESCPAAGSVFLDELGEMELLIQVKLLRVIETRKFSAVGDTAVREFSGKLIGATNRHLHTEIQAGRFREDLYYRLCADLIQTPSLREQIEDSPEVLRDLILFMVRRSVGDEAERCLPEVVAWVESHLPRGYPWPGNYRELEQCVRNVIIRRSYQPLADREREAGDPFLTRFRECALTADEVLSYYAAQVYGKTGSYESTARKLGLDRRTVKLKVEMFLSCAVGS